MVQSLPKPMTFAEFIQWKPENNRYELHDGAIVEMSQPTGEHKDIVGFLAEKLTLEYVRLNLPYSIPKTALVKLASSGSAYAPDILLKKYFKLLYAKVCSWASALIRRGLKPNYELNLIFYFNYDHLLSTVKVYLTAMRTAVIKIITAESDRSKVYPSNIDALRNF